MFSGILLICVVGKSEEMCMFRVTWQWSARKCRLKKDIYGRAAVSFSDDLIIIALLSLDHIDILYP